MLTPTQISILNALKQEPNEWHGYEFIRDNSNCKSYKSMIKNCQMLGIKGHVLCKVFNHAPVFKPTYKKVEPQVKSNYTRTPLHVLAKRRKEAKKIIKQQKFKPCKFESAQKKLEILICFFLENPNEVFTIQEINKHLFGNLSDAAVLYYVRKIWRILIVTKNSNYKRKRFFQLNKNCI